MKHLFVKLLLLICVCLILGGCAPGLTVSTKPEQPVIHTLNSAVHCTVIPKRDGVEFTQFEAELNVSVTVNETGRDDISFTMSMPDEWNYDFSIPDVKCYSQHEERNLPYYCFAAHFDYPFGMAVDVDAGYFIAKINANYTDWYLVASVDPETDPYEILNHFSVFQELYDLTEENKLSLFWNLSGNYVTEDGKVGEKVDLMLSALLPEQYEVQSDVELKTAFIWPDGFRYNKDSIISYTGSVDVAKKHKNQVIYHGTGWLHDAVSYAASDFDFMICPEEEFVVIHIAEEHNYIVASTDPNADPIELLSFYKDYAATSQ